MDTRSEVPRSVRDLRVSYANFPMRTPDPTVHRGLERGWLVPYLLRSDEVTWNRWGYWYNLAAQPEGEHALPLAGIPQIEFIGEGGPGSRTRKMLEHSLEQVAPYWTGWGSSEYITYFLDWLLFGFGHEIDLPREPTEGASDRLYQAFDLGPLLLWPHDYLGDMLAEMNIGKHAGFYPTPHNVVELMVRMTMDDGQDQRLATTCDPCVGTGRMLLLASNYSLCLAGMDINPIMVKATLVNAFLYAPWMARSIPWVWDLAGGHGPREVVDEQGDTHMVSPGVGFSRKARRLVAAGQEVLL